LLKLLISAIDYKIGAIYLAVDIKNNKCYC